MTTNAERDVALIAHAGSYGGIATHLNQLSDQLAAMRPVRSVTLFAVQPFLSAENAKLPRPVTFIDIGGVLRDRPLLRRISIPINFCRELLIALCRRSALAADETVFASHDPNSFWGFVLLSKRAYYFLFVYPDPAQEAKEIGIVRRFTRVLWLGIMRRIVKSKLRKQALTLISPTPYAAAVLARHLEIHEQDIFILSNPPFLKNPATGLIGDLENQNSVVDDILHRAKSHRIVLSVGHFEDYKNPAAWLEIAEFMHERAPDLMFIWVGDGPLIDAVRAGAQGYSRILIPGRLNQADLRRLYEAAWVFFHPAIKESQGVVVMDALTYGVPVILNDSEALPDLIKDSRAGVVLRCNEPDSAKTFAGIIDRLSDQETYKIMSAEAANLAKSRYSFERWIAVLRNLFLPRQ